TRGRHADPPRLRPGGGDRLDRPWRPAPPGVGEPGGRAPVIDFRRAAARGPTMTPAEQPLAVRNEQVLSRQLSSVQQTMMAFGGPIGTGLFLATGLSVRAAGPAVIVSYVIVMAISLLLGRALSEMAVAHPTAGAFGVYADVYLSPLAGYAVRVSYWAMEVIAT